MNYVLLPQDKSKLLIAIKLNIKKKLLSAGEYAFNQYQMRTSSNESSILTVMSWVSVRLLFVIQRLKNNNIHKNSWHFTLKGLKD